MPKNLSSIPDEIFLDHLFPFIPHSSLVSLKTSNNYFNKLIWDFWGKRKTRYIIPYGIRSGKFEKVSQCFISKLSNLREIVAAGSLEPVDCGQELDDFAFAKMLGEITGKVMRLDLVQCDSLSGYFLQSAIEMKLPLLHSLEELLFKDLDFGIGDFTLKEFINLKRVTLTGSKFAVSEMGSFNFPTCLEKLVLNLELTECFILDIPNQCPNLTELHVKGVSDDVAIHLLVSLPKLTSFHIIQDEEESFIDNETPNKIFSVFKKRGVKLNVHSFSLPYILCEKPIFNPFGIYSEKLIELNLTLKGDPEENDQDELLNTLLTLKNLKRLSLSLEEQLHFSNNVLHSFSTSSTLKHLEYLHCTLTKGSGCLIAHIVDSNLREISLKGEESHFDFNFLNRYPNIEKIVLDLIVESSNLRDVIMKSGHGFSKLKHVSGQLITSDIVELFPNKERIETLYLNYKNTVDLKPFKFLKKLCLFMDDRFPENVILPVSLNSLKIVSQNIETSDTGFSNNILALKNLRYLNLKMESLKDDAVIAICKKDSPIEELAIYGSKHMTNSVAHHLSCMENLRNLFIDECSEFKDCNEISLLEYERSFRLFSSKLSERKFNFSKTASIYFENLKNQSLSSVLPLERAEQLLKERKLFELNIITSFALNETKIKHLSTSNMLFLSYYYLLSSCEQSCLTLIVLIPLVTSLQKQIPKLDNEQREKLRYCSSKSLEYVITYGDDEVACILISILLELDDMETISKKISLICPLITLDFPPSIAMIKIFMEKCINIGRVRLLQLFSSCDIVVILSNLVEILPIRSTPLFATFCRMIISTFTLNIDCSLLTDKFIDIMSNIVAIHNPFSDISREIKTEKETQPKVDPFDESISLQEKIAIAVDPSWINPKDTHIECVDIDINSKNELFKKVRSKSFEAFGFKWYLTIQIGEYLGEISTSLHLDSVYPTNNNTQILDYLKVRVLFLNFNFDPSFYFVRTHKFQFKDDFVSDNTYFEKDPFKKSEESQYYRTIIGLQFIGMEMKPIPTMRNDPQISLSLKHPWLFKQISKERPISHQTISILTPIDVLEDDCFSSDSFNVFGNDIIFYITPHSKKSGLFGIDISGQFDATDIFKVKYFFSNESFEPDSVCIGKYDRINSKFAENEEEKKDYHDVEEDFILVEPKFYEPTIIEREQGKFFKKYVFQVVMVLGNTSQGLDTSDPFANMSDDDDDWDDM